MWSKTYPRAALQTSHIVACNSDTFRYLPTFSRSWTGETHNQNLLWNTAFARQDPHQTPQVSPNRFVSDRTHLFSGQPIVRCWTNRWILQMSEQCIVLSQVVVPFMCVCVCARKIEQEKKNNLPLLRSLSQELSFSSSWNRHTAT